MSELTNLEWHDKHISPALFQIERHATWVQHHARELIARPAFETRAEHELAQAEASLMLALGHIRHAREAYASKTTERRHAA